MGRISTTLLLLAGVLHSRAEIIDRIAVSVANRVITVSDIDRQIRITAFLNGDQADFSAESKRRTAERLVEQALIRREIATTRYITLQTGSDPSYQEVRKSYKDAATYERALAGYGITDADVKEALNWQATLLEFVSVRFRPGVHLTDAELKDYFDTELAPKLAAGGEAPPFEDVRDKVESILTQHRVDSALDRWLGQSRTQTRIRYNREVMR